MFGMPFSAIFLLIAVSILAKACAKNCRLDLNGAWTAFADDGSVSVQALVPGGIFTAMLNAKLIEDPYYGYNDQKYRKYSNANWTYERQFYVDEYTRSRSTVVLVLDGVDTVSRVFVNDHLVGATVNMFVRYSFNIKKYLQTTNDTLNRLTIRLESPVAYAARKASERLFKFPPACTVPEQHGECHVNYIRKEQCSFSWDWGPSFPSMGIWKNASLQAFDCFYVDEVSTEIFKQGAVWMVNVTALYQTTPLGAGRAASVSLQIGGESPPITEHFHLQTLSGTFSKVFKVPFSPKLWWPNGYGAQTLYSANISVSCGGDSYHFLRKVGFKTIKLLQAPLPKPQIGLTFLFLVNDVPMFMKGSNWIPADSFRERITSGRLRNLLSSAAQGHMTMMRVWGGGAYESDEFYELTDELGILIWQDFMFACSMYPDDSDYLETVRTEAEQQVRRIKGHVSLAVWAGNNENEAALRGNWYGTNTSFPQYKEAYINLYVDTLMPIARGENPSIPYLTSSPTNGAESQKEGWIAQNPYSPLYGDIHYYDYDPGFWWPVRAPKGRFMSEYGIQSWPSFESIHSISTPQDWYPQSVFSAYRNHHPQGQSQLQQELSYYFNEPAGNDNSTKFTNYIYLTQINQAMSIKAQTEMYRRSALTMDEKGQGLTFGALYWQLNDIWQAPTWASLEYSGKWKMLHYYAKHFFAPSSVTISVDSNGILSLHVAADKPCSLPPSFVAHEDLSLLSSPGSGNFHDVELDEEMSYKLGLYSWTTFEPLYTTLVPMPPSNQCVQKIFERNLTEILTAGRCPNNDSCFLYTHLLVKGTPVFRDGTSNFFLLGKPKDFKTLEDPKLAFTGVNQGEQAGEFTLTLFSDSVAAFVWIDTLIAGRFSDNGFIMMENEVNITFYSWEPTTSKQLFSSLTAMSLFDAM